MNMQPNSVSNNKKKGYVPVHLAVIASLLAEMMSRDIDYTSIFERLEPGKKSRVVLPKPENSQVIRNGFWSWINERQYNP